MQLRYVPVAARNTLVLCSRIDTQSQYLVLYLHFKLGGPDCLRVPLHHEAQQADEARLDATGLKVSTCSVRSKILPSKEVYSATYAGSVASLSPLCPWLCPQGYVQGICPNLRTTVLFKS